MTDTNDREPHIKEFASFLVEHRNGATHDEISQQFHDLIAAVAQHGKKGELVIRWVVEPSKQTEGSPMAIAASTSVKAPREEPRKALFFLDDDGNPVRDNPNQLTFELRDAPTRPTKLRSTD